LIVGNFHNPDTTNGGDRDTGRDANLEAAAAPQGDVAAFLGAGLSNRRGLVALPLVGRGYVKRLRELLSK
jgi:hypothetical protein